MAQTHRHTHTLLLELGSGGMLAPRHGLAFLFFGGSVCVDRAGVSIRDA